MRKLIVGIIIVSVLCVVSLSVLSGDKEEFTSVEKIKLDSISSHIDTKGEIISKEYSEVYSTVEMALKVKKVLVKEYSKVKKNQKIVEYDIPKYIDENIKKRIDEISKSPLTGVITEMNLIDGEYINNSNAIFKVMNLDMLYIKSNIKASHIKNIKLEQKVKITGEIFSKKENLAGKITKISPISSKTPNGNVMETTVEVDISLENIPEYIRPGMELECEIVTNNKDKALIGSFKMLKQDKDNLNYVYKVDSNNKINKTMIKIGIVSDMNFEILKGLNKNDLVVVDPKSTLKDGDEILIDDKK